jgi:hypothetical protein
VFGSRVEVDAAQDQQHAVGPHHATRPGVFFQQRLGDCPRHVPVLGDPALHLGIGAIEVQPQRAAVRAFGGRDRHRTAPSVQTQGENQSVARQFADHARSVGDSPSRR